MDSAEHGYVAIVLVVGEQAGAVALAELCNGLRRTPGFKYEFCEARRLRSAISTRGEVQAVCVIDDAASEAGYRAEDVKGYRPEIDVYVVEGRSLRAVHQQNEHRTTVDSPREIGELQDAACLIERAISRRLSTPFVDALIDHCRNGADQWHTPGHIGGRSFQLGQSVRRFYDFIGVGVFTADQSVSVSSLDSLTHSSGAVLEAERLASEAFGALRTMFCTNGTSAANRIVLQALLRPGDKLIVDRACHQSVHDGVINTGAVPIYLECTYNPRYGLFGPVPRDTVLHALESHKGARLLVLTSCTYDGLRYNLKPIVDAAHASGVKVLIDEAWYAHGRFHPSLRPTALESGADYVTQSTHKTLSALSQASMIHIADPEADYHRLDESRRMHSSSSPLYALIASLDAARKQAVAEGYSLLSRALRSGRHMRQQIDAIPGLRSLQVRDMTCPSVHGDDISLDETKVTVDLSSFGYSGSELGAALRDRGIQIEKHTHSTITFLVTIGTSSTQAERLVDTLSSLRRSYKAFSMAAGSKLPPLGSLQRSPRDAFHCEGESVRVLTEDGQPNASLIGRICSDLIVAYPPGIPALLPGQSITDAALRFLVDALERESSMHGLVSAAGEPCIRVVALT